MTALRSTCIGWVVATVGLVAPVRADVTILGKPQLGSFAAIQDAVNAASDFDVLLVHPDTYDAGFTIDDKALTLIATGVVHVQQRCAVRNLGALRRVALVGIKITGKPLSVQTAALKLENNAGHVRIQGCNFVGGSQGASTPAIPAPHGVWAVNCSRVVLSQSTSLGMQVGTNIGGNSAPGGDGLNAVDSSVALYDCTLTGGRGSGATLPGGKGGAGCRVTNFGVFASGATLKGGNGGSGDAGFCGNGGAGGDALVVNGAQAQLLELTLVAGAAGPPDLCGYWPPPVPGQQVVSNGGVVTYLAGAARKLTAPPQVNDNAPIPFTITGQPGDSAWLVVARAPRFLYQPALNGVLTVPMPTLSVVPLGTIGSSGTLNIALPVRDGESSQGGWVRYVQGLCVDTAQNSFLTSPLVLLVNDV